MKTIWIWNHYATDSIAGHNGRHHYFAKYLKEFGYNPIIFCASVIHNTNKEIDIDGLYKIEIVDGITHIIIKTRKYAGNGKDRVLNIFDFYKNIKKAAKEMAKSMGNPWVIYASSVHPLTLVAGIQIGKKMNVPCICEVRDLWPESLIAYGKLKRNSIIAALLYRGEHWIYKKANALVFTMEGGASYIEDRGWDIQNHAGNVNLDKIFHINNGVDIKEFDFNKTTNVLDDPQLNNSSKFKCGYTGSIREANHVEILVDTAKWLQDIGAKDIELFIYGDGPELEALKERVSCENLKNIFFKGRVEKIYIPYTVSKMSLLLDAVGVEQFKQIAKYGQSKNKSFDYLAAGKPIINVYAGDKKFDYIEANGAGVSLMSGSPEEYGTEILNFYEMDKAKYQQYCVNARKTAEEKYDFKQLTKQLLTVCQYADDNYKK